MLHTYKGSNLALVGEHAFSLTGIAVVTTKPCYLMAAVGLIPQSIISWGIPEKPPHLFVTVSCHILCVGKMAIL